MLRFVWVLGLLLVAGGVVASGISGSWTQAHFVIGGSAAALAVLALLPTKRPATVGQRGR